jgi:hypothetical protein
MRTRVPVGSRHHAAKAPRFKFTRIDKCLNETPRVSSVLYSSRRGGDWIALWRFAPWLWPIAVVNAVIEPSTMYALCRADSGIFTQSGMWLGSASTALRGL